MNMTTAIIESVKLMSQHGLISQGWKLEISRGKNGLGQCSFRKRIIKISKYLIEMNDWVEVKDTVLHEIAHFLCGPYNFPYHNWRWKMMCVKIGANPQRLAHDNVKMPQKYISICPVCGKTYYVNKRGKHFEHYSCRRCRSPLTFKENLDGVQIR